MSHHSRHHSKSQTPLSLMELLEEKIDENSLLRGIELSEDDLIGSAIKQPELFWLAGRLRVQSMHKRASHELELEAVSARVGVKARNSKDDKGKREFTEGHVKARIELDPRVQRLRKKLNKDFEMEEATKQLLDVYRMRRDIIRVVADAGKISLHMKELELLKGNRRLHRAVENIRSNWKNPLDYGE